MTERKMLRIAVVNPLGLAGKEVRSFLRERHFPIASVRLIDSGGGSEGALTDEGGEATVVTPLEPGQLAGFDLVFLCEPDAAARKDAIAAAKSGTAVVEMPAEGTVAPKLPRLVSGLNDQVLSDGGPRHVSIPSAATTLLARLLAPLRSLGTLRRLTLHVVEPASLAGDAGVEEMLAQAVALLAFKPLPKNTFGRQMVFNIFSDAEPDPAALRAELTEVTGLDVPLALSILRGPTFHGHGFSLLFEYDPKGAPDVAAIRHAIESDPELHYDGGELVPGTVEASGTDVVHVAALRAEPAIAGGFWAWMVVDHLRRGTALNAVRLAETMTGVAPPAHAAPRLRRGRT